MNLLKRLLVALGLASFLLAASAGIASAGTNTGNSPIPKSGVHGTNVGNSPQPSTGPVAPCSKSSVIGRTPVAIGEFVSSTKGDPCAVQLSIFSVPDGYNGKGAADPSAHPQKLFDRVVATLTADPQTVKVNKPPSRWCQVDYKTVGSTKVNLYGKIVECNLIGTVTPGHPVQHPAAHHKAKHHAKVSPKPVVYTASSGQLAYTGVNLAAYGAAITFMLLSGGLLLGLIKPKRSTD